MAERIIAFIDGQNLHLSTQTLGWRIDYHRLRIYLKDQYKVTRAIIFLGYLAGNERLYKSLQESGYELVFRPEAEVYQSKVRGNIETELTLAVVAEVNNYERAVIVTGDGDFYCVIDFLNKRGKLHRLLVPNYYKYSTLLNRYAGSKLDYISSLRNKVEYFNGEKTAV